MRYAISKNNVPTFHTKRSRKLKSVCCASTGFGATPVFHSDEAETANDYGCGHKQTHNGSFEGASHIPRVEEEQGWDRVARPRLQSGDAKFSLPQDQLGQLGICDHAACRVSNVTDTRGSGMALGIFISYKGERRE